MAPVARSERVLWTLGKDTCVAEARLHGYPHGPELAFYVNGQSLWLQVFKDGGGAALGEVADSKRREFEERGWTLLEAE